MSVRGAAGDATGRRQVEERIVHLEGDDLSVGEHSSVIAQNGWLPYKLGTRCRRRNKRLYFIQAVDL